MDTDHRADVLSAVDGAVTTATGALAGLVADLQPLLDSWTYDQRHRWEQAEAALRAEIRQLQEERRQLSEDLLGADVLRKALEDRIVDLDRGLASLRGRHPFTDPEAMST